MGLGRFSLVANSVYLKALCFCLLGDTYLSAYFFNMFMQLISASPAYVCTAGPSCSELMMSLVNISLKFQTLISNIYQFFC